MVLAFGTADGGGPQVGGLLRGLPQHLHPQEARAQVGEDEGSPGSQCGRGEALLPPSAEAAVAGEGGGAAEPAQRAPGHRGAASPRQGSRQGVANGAAEEEGGSD